MKPTPLLAQILLLSDNTFLLRWVNSLGQHESKPLDLSQTDNPKSWVNAELEARRLGFDVDWDSPLEQEQ